MHSPETFETRLTDAFARYVAAMPVEPDAVAVAATAVGSAPRRRSSEQGARRVWVLAAAGLLLVGIVGGLIVVSGLATPSPSPSPVAPNTNPVPSRVTSYAGQFVTVAPMKTSRLTPIAVGLPDGRAWIAAGQIAFGNPLPDIPSELYDPSTGTSTDLTGTNPSDRGSALLLADGRILAISSDSNLTSSMLFLVSPQAGTSRRTWAGSAPVFGVSPSLSLLASGNVLVAGGKPDYYKPEVTSTTHIFDLSTQSFVDSSPMTVARVDHAVATLPDGRVLIAGGGRVVPHVGGGFNTNSVEFDGTAEIADPAVAAFNPVPSTLGAQGPMRALALADGRILLYPVMGVWARRDGDVSGVARPLDSASRIFDPRSIEFGPGPILRPGSTDAVALADGRVLVIGWIGSGGDDETYERWAAIWDPTSDTVTSIDPPEARDPGVALLADGRVILAGGSIGDKASLSHRTTMVQIFQ